MRLTDLRDAKLRTLDGERLGRVHEVHTVGGRVVALSYGTAGLLERMTGKAKAHKVPWECVVRIEGNEILVAPEPAKSRSRSPRGSRSRQGTRRPNEPRSKR